MAAIAKLTTIAAGKFRGGSEDTRDLLRTEMNLVLGKGNEIIDALTGVTAVTTTTFNKLYIGAVGGPYGGGNPSWLIIDGTNAPTLGAIRFLDTTLGTYKQMTVANGLVAIA